MSRDSPRPLACWPISAPGESWRRCGSPVSVVEHVPVDLLVRSAGRAIRAGWLAEAAVLAEAAIESAPGQRAARRLHEQAMDSLQVARGGWPVEEPADPAYTPAPLATLSVLAQSLPHRSGGYATRSHGVLTGLRALGWDTEAVTRLGHPYDRWPVLSTDVVPDVDVVDGVTYRRLLEPGERTYDTVPLAAYLERFTHRIMREATARRVGVIHASSFQHNGLAGLAAARRLGIKFVYEMRGLEDLMKVSRNPDFAQSSAYQAMTRLENHIVAHADLTLVITEALRAEMIARGGPADRIRVMPNGVHTSAFQPRDPDPTLLDELGLRGRTIIGYAGGLVDYEGLELLIEATAALRARRDDFAVIVVGDGHHEARLHQLANDLGVNDVLTFTGRVPHHEVARYLSVFDITPFPRLPLPVCELISPIKPFEAMAMGKAVVASSVAALAEIVTDGDRGLLFDKGDSGSLAATLERYLDDPQLRADMGARAREWVLAERDWAHMVLIVDQAYRELLGTGPDRS